MFDTDSRRRTIVHVWTNDGTYVGQVYTSSMMQFEVLADDKDHAQKIKQALTNQAKRSDFLEVRAGEWREAFEFPGPEWLTVASLLLLPRIGYRVHIIADAREPHDA